MFNITKNLIKMPFYFAIGYFAIILTAFIGIIEIIKNR